MRCRESKTKWSSCSSRTCRPPHLCKFKTETYPVNLYSLLRQNTNACIEHDAYCLINITKSVLTGLHMDTSGFSKPKHNEVVIKWARDDSHNYIGGSPFSREGLVMWLGGSQFQRGPDQECSTETNWGVWIWEYFIWVVWIWGVLNWGWIGVGFHLIWSYFKVFQGYFITAFNHRAK